MAQRNDNGNGTIYYDKQKKRWVARIQWSDKRGEKHRKSFSDAKKSAVRNKLDEFRKQLLLASGNISEDEVSFEEYSKYWLENVVKNKLKPTSYNRKKLTLEKQVYPYIGNIPLSQLTHYDIQNMINTLTKEGLSYSTIKKAYEAVNGCIREYRIKKTSFFNPCEGVSLPINKQRNTSNIDYFNDEQIELIKKEATRKFENGTPVYRLGDAIILLLYTGMRIGELLALTWDDVNFKEKMISIDKNAVVVKKEENDNESHYILINQTSTKTASGCRTIPISNNALNALLKIYAINGKQKYVMSTKTGKQVTPRNINRMFHSILIQTGISKNGENLCGVHTLRHTFASMLFKNGCDVKIVSELLGHSDTKITENIYIHVIQQQKVKAIQDIDKYIA